MKTALIAKTIFDGTQFYTDHALMLDGSQIAGLITLSELPTDYQQHQLTDGVLAPGFIDLQVNGGGGVLFNNQTNAQGIEKIIAGHRLGGTTTLLPTLISDIGSKHQHAIAAIRQVIAEGNDSVLGVHLEGPFFDMQRRGTHAKQYIRPLEKADVDALCAVGDVSLLLTLAPEHTSAGQIKRLTQAGHIVCAGHSNANYAQVQTAVAEGLSGFTHLYNAMSPMLGREPGMVGSALTTNQTWCGIIADGYHVHPDMIRLAHQAKPRGKLYLVTDAMATVGSDDNSFELYGSTITEQGGRLINAEGRLAGSAISMMDAVRISHKKVGIELGESLRMASLYPAEFFKVSHMLGKLEQGFRADLVHFDEDFNVLGTWVAGKQ